MEMNEEGGEELEEETWLEEMKPGMVLFWQVQTFPADLPSAPASFSGVSFVSPPSQSLPRGLWADQKSRNRPRIQILLQRFPRLFPFSFPFLFPFS